MRITQVLQGTSKLHKVLVVGGGAGGVEVVTRLGKSVARKGIARAVLVNSRITHIWKPLLHEVATGVLNVGEDELNFFSHSHTYNYEFRFGRMNSLDREKKVIKTGVIKYDKRMVSDPQEIRYDTLVLAVGSTPDTFGLPGVYENCVFLNTPKEAEFLRKTILTQALAVRISDGEEDKIRIGIVGGGATGVELAAEIQHFIEAMHIFGVESKKLQITILENAPRILGALSDTFSTYATAELKKKGIEVMTNCGLQGVTEKGFILKDGSVLRKDIRIWTAGIKSPDWLKKTGLTLNHQNRVKVTPHLQTLEDPNIFVIGDCCCSPVPGDATGTLCQPATAQVAHQQAAWLSKHLENVILKGKLSESGEPFKFASAGVLVSLGEKTAVGTVTMGPKTDMDIQGRAAKVLYESLYRQHQMTLYGPGKTFALWFGDKLRHVARPLIKFH